MTPKVGETWVHVQSGALYTIFLVCKIRLAGCLWDDGVTYQSANGSFFTRSESDFMRKFKRVSG